MSNKRQNANANANANANIKIEKTKFNFELFVELERQCKLKGNEIYKINLIQGEIGKNDKALYEAQTEKEFEKIEEWINCKYGVEKNTFYRYVRAYDVPKDVREAYEKQESGQKTISKLLEFAKKKDDTKDSEVKKDDSLKISVKDGKITIKGNAEISEIDLLISELQRMKQAKNSPKAA